MSKRVFIGVGHGGVDPGAVGYVGEADANPIGAYGLYDRVNGEFYGNAGTGAFTGAVAA